MHTDSLATTQADGHADVNANTLGQDIPVETADDGRTIEARLNDLETRVNGILSTVNVVVSILKTLFPRAFR